MIDAGMSENEDSDKEEGAEGDGGDEACKEEKKI